MGAATCCIAAGATLLLLGKSSMITKLWKTVENTFSLQRYRRRAAYGRQLTRGFWLYELQRKNSCTPRLSLGLRDQGSLWDELKPYMFGICSWQCICLCI